MTPSVIVSRKFFSLLFAILILPAILWAQDPASKPAFYDVQVAKEEIYSYTNLRFKGDYSLFESAAGKLALGRTEGGVTVAIILGNGTATIEAPNDSQDKIKSVFEVYPLKLNFNAVYIRINPKEYEETFGKLKLANDPSDEALAKAKEQFDTRFLNSYHAGAKAILPPYKTRVFEIDTADGGHICYEEGYWLRLFRVSPYGKVYPTGFVNPKQK